MTVSESVSVGWTQGVQCAWVTLVDSTAGSALASLASLLGHSHVRCLALCLRTALARRLQVCAVAAVSAAVIACASAGVGDVIAVCRFVRQSSGTVGGRLRCE